MNSLLLQKGAPSSGRTALLARLSPRGRSARLRRKGPSWVGMALLVLIADILLAMLAWGAVGLVLN